jgi:DNA-directed RNA polymerase specialized sigma24 family protein
LAARDRNQPAPVFDQDACRRLLAGVRATEEPAWRELLAMLWPELTRILRGARAMAVFAKSDDHVRNVVLLAMERLGKDGCRAAHLAEPWLVAHPDKTLADWLRILATNMARDYVRERTGRAARDGDAPAPDKRLLGSLADLLRDEDELPPASLLSATSGCTARELARWAEGHLPPDQLAALTAWLGGASFEDIARELHLEGGPAAKRVVRAAVAALRRHAAAQSGTNTRNPAGNGGGSAPKPPAAGAA